MVLELKGVVNDEGDADEGAIEDIGVVEVDLDELGWVRSDMPLQRLT